MWSLSVGRQVSRSSRTKSSSCFLIAERDAIARIASARLTRPDASCFFFFTFGLFFFLAEPNTLRRDSTSLLLLNALAVRLSRVSFLFAPSPAPTHFCWAEQVDGATEQPGGARCAKSMRVATCKSRLDAIHIRVLMSFLARATLPIVAGATH